MGFLWDMGRARRLSLLNRLLQEFSEVSTGFYTGSRKLFSYRYTCKTVWVRTRFCSHSWKHGRTLEFALPFTLFVLVSIPAGTILRFRFCFPFHSGSVLNLSSRVGRCRFCVGFCGCRGFCGHSVLIPLVSRERRNGVQL